MEGGTREEAYFAGGSPTLCETLVMQDCSENPCVSAVQHFQYVIHFPLYS